MRVVPILAVIVAIGCGFETGESPSMTASTARVPARLDFAGLYPLTVTGRAFRARERVRLTLSGSRRASTVVVADRRGRFTARFAVRIPACGTAFVRAVGSAGSRASRELSRPDCREP